MTTAQQEHVAAFTLVIDFAAAVLKRCPTTEELVTLHCDLLDSRISARTKKKHAKKAQG